MLVFLTYTGSVLYTIELPEPASIKMTTCSHFDLHRCVYNLGKSVTWKLLGPFPSCFSMWSPSCCFDVMSIFWLQADTLSASVSTRKPARTSMNRLKVHGKCVLVDLSDLTLWTTNQPKFIMNFSSWVGSCPPLLFNLPSIYARPSLFIILHHFMPSMYHILNMYLSLDTETK